MNEEQPQSKSPISTVEEFYQELIQQLKEQGKIGNSCAYLSSYYSLKLFNKGKPLHYTFDRIDALFLRKFEDFLVAKGNKETTMHFQFRTLRATYKRAIEAQMASVEKNPFNSFKVSKFNTKTQKRALEKQEVHKLLQVDTSQESAIRQLAQDIFAFSYLAGGISFVDIAHLTQEQIEQGRLRYNRHKTRGQINLRTPLQLLQSEMLHLPARHITAIIFCPFRSKSRSALGDWGWLGAKRQQIRPRWQD